ncbi:MAG: heme exporter protein CcmD [Hyphomonadaceae bacterium]|nr:MAG: hypothetical protein FD160_2277 [Caulobacteraceae bacterium]MBT9446159.1 heme exporter protein CcmD [Hyphomonadaceae bacterium]TPW04420.1 MAG: hypothetical protein FD124_2632 [Alphaproteobacteria bacterium]
MSEALTQLMASEHWPYVWPCYLLAVLTFAGLTVRALADLAHWKKRAQTDDRKDDAGA